MDNKNVTIPETEYQALIHNQMLDFLTTVSIMEELDLTDRQIQQLTMYIVGTWLKGKPSFNKVWDDIDLKASARWMMDFFDRVHEEQRLLDIMSRTERKKIEAIILEADIDGLIDEAQEIEQAQGKEDSE